MAEFTEVSAKAESIFERVWDRITLPFEVSYKLIGNDKQKGLVKLMKVSDLYKHFIKTDVIIVFNSIYADVLDDSDIEILINQELDRIEADAESGKINVVKAGFITSPGVITKFGLEAVARANKLSELFGKQKDDVQAMQHLVNNYKGKSILQEDGVDFLK